MDIDAGATRENLFDGGKLVAMKSQAKQRCVAGACILFSALMSNPAYSASFGSMNMQVKNLVGGTFNDKVEKTLTDDDTVNPMVDPQSTNRLTGTVAANKQVVLASKQHIKLGGLHGFLVNVHNDTEQTLMFDGDNATANFENMALSSASVADVDNVAMPNKRLARDVAETSANVVIAAATIGGAAAAKDTINQSGPVAHRYGADEARRIDEQSRFGRRVLLPGESTTGVLYFKKGKGAGSSKAVASAAPASISIPVSPMYDEDDAITGLRQ